jgi:hypothetical protein
VLGVEPIGLQRALLASYGDETRREAGIVVQPQRAAGGCVRLADADQSAVVASAARRVAARLAAYRAAVLPHYVLLYLDVLLSKAGGKGDAPTVLARMLEFVEACGNALFADGTAQETSKPAERHRPASRPSRRRGSRAPGAAAG